jgi:hypothetical protein
MYGVRLTPEFPEKEAGARYFPAEGSAAASFFKGENMHFDARVTYLISSPLL